jgi:predicted nucleic acid-binding protein
MSLVVSDASPLHYLILIGTVDVLPLLFSKVMVPEHVISQELQAPRTPRLVQDWVRKLPPWVEIRRPSSTEKLGLGLGEEQAIALAIELLAPLLVDERDAREIAEGKGVLVVGTLGIIERAARKKLLDVTKALADLRKTNFRISQTLIAEVIQRSQAEGGL